MRTYLSPEQAAENKVQADKTTAYLKNNTVPACSFGVKRDRIRQKGIIDDEPGILPNYHIPSDSYSDGVKAKLPGPVSSPITSIGPMVPFLQSTHVSFKNKFRPQR